MRRHYQRQDLAMSAVLTTSNRGLATLRDYEDVLAAGDREEAARFEASVRRWLLRLSETADRGGENAS